MLRGFRVSTLFFYNISDRLPNSCHQSLSGSRRAVPPLMMRLLCSYNSTDGDGGRTPKGLSSGSTSDRPSSLSAGLAYGDDDDDGGDANYYRYKKENERLYNDHRGRQQKLPDQPLHGLSRRKFDLGLGERRVFDYPSGKYGSDKPKPSTRVVGGVNKNDNRQSNVSNLFPFDEEEKPQIFPTHQGEKQQDDYGFLEKFKLGFDQGEKKPHSNDLDSSRREGEEGQGTNGAAIPEPPPQDADEIFKKMKETGLIPNAVAMLHGLCNDGLVQEAMKLFGLMREKGTIPEVVIYTAVVEGFCQAERLDDAKRIFRKMQNNGISANAFSYAVLVQGLCKGKRLEDALEFCVEMLEDGHSPNLATFTGLVDEFCREKGLEAAQVMIGTLRHKGFLFDEKAVREFLDKKGPFLPLVWEAIFGKKSSQRCF